MRIIELGGVVVLLLAVAKALFPDTFVMLPLGGSNIAEVGIVFGIAIACAKLAELSSGKDE